VGKREQLPNSRLKHSTPRGEIEFFLSSLNSLDSRMTLPVKEELQNERDFA
jgi:hypothetical protein